MKHQPMVVDGNGVIRFRENKIVSFLLEHGGFDLNKLATMNFSQEDHAQFAQLIGYSVSGWGDLSYAPRREVMRTDAMASRLARKIEKQARGGK